jgi:death-on-curing protein
VSEPVWIAREVVLAIHDEQLAEHGGRSGVRDMGALESALGRPRNLLAYSGANLIAAAAAYAFGIARNHPFIDGNKRVSAVVTELFLALNGLNLTATDEEVVTTWLELATGRLDQDQPEDWLRAKTAPRTAS